MNRDGRLIAFFFVLAITLTASWPVRAETIFLTCNQGTFTIDLTNKTVNNLPATINATSIDWEVHTTYPDDGTTYSGQVHIDRTSGLMTSSGTLCFGSGGYKGTCRPGPSGPPTACTKGEPPPVKF